MITPTLRAPTLLALLSLAAPALAAPQAEAPAPPASNKAATRPAETATSKDGTGVAYDRAGSGPALVLVSGALSDRASAKALAAAFAPRFTVYAYDRRGRGQSGDTASYSVEREVDDIEAIVDRAGGKAFLFGSSSGAVLALEAASRFPSKIVKVALYEPPFVVDDTRPPVPPDFVARVRELVAAGRRGDAVELFMVEGVGVPAEMIPTMKKAPMWVGLERLAHTLAYDGLVMGDTQSGKPLPERRWAGATAPALVLDGGKSDAWLRTAAAALTATLPNAKRRTLEGQTHRVSPAAVAPVVTEFFEGK